MTAISGSSFLSLPTELHAKVLESLKSDEQISLVCLVCKELQKNALPILCKVLQNRQFSTPQNSDPRIFILFESWITKSFVHTISKMDNEKEVAYWKNIDNPAVRLLDLESGTIKICSQEFINYNPDLTPDTSLDNAIPDHFFRLTNNEVTCLTNFQYDADNFTKDFKAFIDQVNMRLLLPINSTNIQIMGLGEEGKKISDSFYSPTEIMKKAIRLCEISDILFVEDKLIIQGNKLDNLTPLLMTQIFTDAEKLSKDVVEHLIIQLIETFNLENKTLKFNKNFYLQMCAYLEIPLNGFNDILTNFLKLNPFSAALWFSIDYEGNFDYNRFLISKFFLTCQWEDAGLEKPGHIKLIYDQNSLSEIKELLNKENDKDILKLLSLFFQNNPQFMFLIPHLFPELEVEVG